jgi:hypothetical protein
MSKTREVIQRRRACPADFEVIRADALDATKIAGHAAVFDVKADLGYATESIAAGAFEESLTRGDDVRALFNHDPSLILGRTASKTLELREDNVGLFARISPPDTALGRDIVTLVERGDISQMSFGFYVEEEEARFEKGEKPHYTITRARLFDVSAVTFPAYVETDLEVERVRAWRSDRDRERREREQAQKTEQARADKAKRDREIERLKF